MIAIRQFRYSSDNFGYLIHNQRFAMAIDAGAVQSILSYIKHHGLELNYVTNTHSHTDHTSGNAAVLKASGARFIPAEEIVRLPAIEWEGHPVHIYPTPGHTHDSICFHIDSFLITGDTLFNGTVGNCFTGDLKGFYDSIKRLMSLPEDTRVYAGHDYVKNAMHFAKQLEPDNSAIDHFLRTYNPANVYSTLHDELNINPYLRFNQKGIISILEARGLPVDTEYQRWESVMHLE
ncbi:MAG: MBL fold metallo-hydrolase [Desulfobacterales bacterium]|nr:MBL fold metallo-hydrolase [Desulfobacterales bacterium]MDD4393014.1 MBL fold metallo-hydrolase [Desulfobacterales bacterium]